MLKNSTVLSNGTVQTSDPKVIAAAYLERKNNNVSTNEKDKLFISILKNIIINNAKYKKSSGDFNLVGTIGNVVDIHQSVFPMCFTDRQGNIYENKKDFCDCCRNNFQNWIGDWVYPEKKINIFPAKNHTSSQIINERELLIDFLLYFNYKEYRGSYADSVKKFNATLDAFGYGPLYHMNYQELCVLSAFKLSKEGEDIYAFFNKLYNNPDFKEMIEAPSSVEEIDDFEQFTTQIIHDFNKVTSLGCKENAIPSGYVDDELSLYQFISLYRLSFERARLSSYRLLCAVLLGEEIGIKLFNEEWDADSMEEIESSVSKKLNNKNRVLKTLFAKLCSNTYEEFLNDYKTNLINQRIYDYKKELENSKSDRGEETTIFDLDNNIDDCREFLKLKGVRGFSDGWKSPISNPKSLKYEDKKKWHEECEAFFLARVNSGGGRNIQNEWVNENREDTDIVWDSYFYRDKSVTKESMVWAMILCLNSKVLKRDIAGRMGAENSNNISKKILARINNLLHFIGMSSLNGNFSESDFLLVNAICHTDYRDVYFEKISYPYREYVFKEIFANMNAQDQAHEINKIENELEIY